MHNSNKNYKYIVVALKAMVMLMVAIVVVSIFIEPMVAVFIFITTVIAVAIAIIVQKFFNEVDEDRLVVDKKVISNIPAISDMYHAVNFPLPYVIINSKKEIIVFNSPFGDILDLQNTGENLEELIGEIDLHVNKRSRVIEGSLYDIYCRKVTTHESIEEIYSLCFVDISEREALKMQIHDETTVVGLLYVDNYDEVMEPLDYVQESMLTANLDKNISEYFSQYGGILKKFEKDRYLFLVSMESLEKLKEKKFDIINTIKTLKVEEHLPVTISLGIGISYINLDLALKSAKVAIDLALGRGGDQVLVKDGDKYLFYGGKSGEGSKNARIRARVKADALEGIIGECSNVLVMGHRQADFDSIGSSLGMYRIITDLGKECNIVLDEPSNGILTIYNKLKKNSIYDNVFVNTQQAMELIYDKTLLVVMDTFIPSIVESRTILDKFKKVVVFDHHRKSTDHIENAVLTYHEPFASSTSELVTEVIRNLSDKVKLKPDEADGLLAGIIVDTKSFTAKTGATTFEAAAFLKRCGADSQRVKQLFKNDFNHLKIKAVTMGNAQAYKNNIVISTCPSTEAGANVLCAQVADELLNIEEVQMAIVLCRIGDVIYISGRSIGGVNVQLLMEKLGGGGHQTMAGAQISNITIEEGLEKVKEAIDKYLEEE